MLENFLDSHLCFNSLGIMIVLDRLKDYCENSTIHGLRYLTEEGRHILERLFWLAAVCTSVAGTYTLAAEAWDSFVSHPVSFVTDTNYLGWNSSFPAVSICDKLDGHQRITEYMKRHQLEVSKLFLYVSAVARKPDDCIVCDTCEDETKGICPDFDDKMVAGTRATCEEIFGACFWNDKQFDCCANFLPIKTEMGPCFTINTLLARPSDPSQKVVELTSNAETGPGELKLFITDPVDVFLHGSEEVPYRNHPKDMVEYINYPAMTSSIIFKLVEIENDPVLRSLSAERRGCRFRDEPLPGSPYTIYSYSTCIVECRMKMQIELCNCTTIFMTRFDDTPLCTPLQLYCLFQNAKQLRIVKPPWAEGSGLDCSCPLGCSELEMAKVWSSLTENPDPDAYIKILIKMASLPSERYQRYVVRTRLDLVVSLGGTAGLFLGASLLSGVEFLIYMLVRSTANNREPSSKAPRSARKISAGRISALE